jgi:WD40 repeat protein
MKLHRVENKLKLLAGLWIVVLLGTGCASVNVVIDEGYKSTQPQSSDLPILKIDTGGHKAQTWDIMFTSNGHHLISASEDKTIRVWDVKTGENAQTLRGQIQRGKAGKIYAAALSPDDRYLAVAGIMANYTGNNIQEVGKIRLIDLRSGEMVRLLKGHRENTLGLAFSLNGELLISGSFGGIARIWDVKTGETLHVLKGHSKAITAVAFSPDGGRVVTGSHDGTLKLWDTVEGSLIATLKEYDKNVRTAAFTPDGRYLLARSDMDKFIRLWDGKSGKFIKTLAGQNDYVTSLAISPDGNKVLTGERKDLIFTSNVYSIPSGELLVSFDKHNNTIIATAISPDGQTAATSGGDRKEIFLWNINNGKVQQKLVGNGSSIFNVAFSKDNRSIAFGKSVSKNHTVAKYGPLKQVFNFKKVQSGSGKETFSLALGSKVRSEEDYLPIIDAVGQWSISPKNTKSAFVNDTLGIMKNGTVVTKIIRGLASGYKHRSMTFSPDGKTVFSGADFGHLTSYNTISGKRVNQFVGHTDSVRAVNVSPDGRWLVSGSADQTIKLWESGTGKLLLTIFHGDDNEWVAWTPEGFFDASPNGDRYVGWHVNKGETKAAEYYSAAQFRRYLYRPDIVNDTLAFSSSQKAIEKAKMQDVTVADLILRSPVDVKIVKVDVQGSGEAEVIVQLGKNKTTAPERITLYVNGSQWLSSNQRNLAGSKPGDTLRYKVHLPKRKNHVRVLVENQWAENKDEKWVENLQGSDRTTAKGTLYVNAIGISKYPGLSADQQLQSPPLDAKNIVNRMKKLEGTLYQKVVVNLLTDLDGNNVTSKRVESMLKQQTAPAGPNDTTLIFLAGHGVTDSKGDYQFITADTQLGTLDGQINISKSGSSFDWSRLHKILDSTRGKRLVFVDTCQAGKVLGASNTDIRKLVKDVHDVNAIIYTGTSRQQLGLETSKGGVFTQTILDGLNGNARYNNGTLLFTSLREYVNQEVPRRNVKILQSMNSRGVLVINKPDPQICKSNRGLEDRGISITSISGCNTSTEPDFDSTQYPVSVIPKGMKGFVISRQ